MVPSSGAMAAREDKIASQLAAARQKRQEAEQEEAALRQKMREIEDQRQEMLAQAEHEAETHKQKLFDPGPAGSGADAPEMGWSPWNGKRRPFLGNLKQRLAQEIFAISRRALRELANQELEQRLVEVFLDRLRQLTPDGTGRPSRTPSRKRGASCSSPPRLSCPRQPGRRSRPRSGRSSARAWPCGSPPPGNCWPASRCSPVPARSPGAWGTSWTPWRRTSAQAFEELEKSEGA